MCFIVFRIARSCRQNLLCFYHNYNKFSLCHHILDRVIRSRSRVAADVGLNCFGGNSVNQLDVISSEVAEKLSELLKVIDKSVRSIEENKVTLAETNELGIRHHTDLVKLQQQQAALATLILQNLHKGTIGRIHSE